MKHLLSAFMAFLVVAVMLQGCGSAPVKPVKIGDKAPDFTLPGVDGTNVSLSSYLGKPVIINTWNVNCIECKKEMPFLQEIGQQYGAQGLVIISVNTLDNKSTTRDFLSKNGYSFVAAIDLNQEIYKKYGCPKPADPYSYFIGRDGTVKSIKIGGFASKDDLAAEVKKIVN